MKQLLLVAHKEFRDAWREKLLLILIACFALLVVVSIVTASQQLGVDVAKYHQSAQQIQASGQVSTLTPPSFSPLRLLRSSIEYFEIIGAVVAIVLGYLSIARERTQQTLYLVLTRPISRLSFAAGKLLGNTMILATIVISFVVIAILSILLVAGLGLQTSELIKLVLAASLALIYLLLFYSLSAALTCVTRTPATALIVMLMLWVGFVLVLPQIGDTMDVDNQVPGGFFASLNLPKTAEKQVLTHYKNYETIRNSTEIMSPTKHFERATFALLGIKQEFDGNSISTIWRARWQNIVTLIVLGITASGVFGLAMKNYKIIRRS